MDGCAASSSTLIASILCLVESADEHGEHVRYVRLIFPWEFAPDPRWKEPHPV